MDARSTAALDDREPEAVAEFFRRAGVSAREHRVLSPTGPRWAVRLHVGPADLWVEAAGRAEAWRKAADYAREVGVLG